jgi:two-component sensor histidine kinase
MTADEQESAGLHQKASRYAAAFQVPLQGNASRQLPDCALACDAIEIGRKELERLTRTQTELRQALVREQVLLEQKDRLITHMELMGHEADHRFLNGLQMVANLLEMQARAAQSPNAADQLNIAAKRVAAIGSIHRRLHSLDHINESIDLKQYIGDICRDMRRVLFSGDSQWNIVVDGITLNVPITTAIPLGYIVSELTMNAAKYSGGDISVFIDTHPKNGCVISVSDEGPGFPKGFDLHHSRGLGMKIVSSLATQIGGEFIVGPNNAGQGTRVDVLFC